MPVYRGTNPSVHHHQNPPHHPNLSKGFRSPQHHHQLQPIMPCHPSSQTQRIFYYCKEDTHTHHHHQGQPNQPQGRKWYHSRKANLMRMQTHQHTLNDSRDFFPNKQVHHLNLYASLFHKAYPLKPPIPVLKHYYQMFQ